MEQRKTWQNIWKSSSCDTECTETKISDCWEKWTKRMLQLPNLRGIPDHGTGKAGGQVKPGRVPKLRRCCWEYGETKKVRVQRSEWQKGKSYTDKTPKLCQWSPLHIKPSADQFNTQEGITLAWGQNQLKRSEVTVPGTQIRPRIVPLPTHKCGKSPDAKGID